MSTAEFLVEVDDKLGHAWFRTLAAELTARDEWLRMRDLGPCDFPADQAVPSPRPTLTSGARCRRPQQLRLGGEAA
jgi:hypothetical protein